MRQLSYVGSAISIALLTAFGAVAEDAPDEPADGAMQTTEAGDDQPEDRLWKETGTTRHGVIEVQKGSNTPIWELDQVDARSLENIRLFWQKLLSKKERILPPLKYMVEVEQAAERSAMPPSSIGLHEKAAGDFVLFENSEPSTAAPAGFSSTVNEPSAVAVDDLVFYTANWYAAASSNGGTSFSFVNPFNGPFNPLPDNGFCCDQVTAYDDGEDALFYLQQSISDATTGTQRINVDQGADGTFDCSYDIRPSFFGFGANSWPDFPDLVVAENYLYHASNVFSTTGAGFLGAFVARYPLDVIGACNAIPFDVYTDGSFSSFKLSRGAEETMYFADHISNASLRIWTWTDAAAMPSSSDRAVTAWTEAIRVCPGPDARDWCGFIDRRLGAAYVADGTVGFAWVPAQDGSFPFPYTRWAQFSEAGLVLSGQPLIWSPNFAWVYPSTAVNARGDLGGTVMAGGGASLYPSCVVWLADDFNGGALAPLENQVAMFGTTGPSTNRSGDYTSTHAVYPNDFLYAGACFAYDTTTSSSSRYIRFGREVDGSLIFKNGFESGDTSAWP